MNDYFYVKKTIGIWIYGYGEIGIALCNKLKQNGWYVKGIIDKRYLEIEKSIFPEQVDKIDQNDVIVLTFQNIQEHEIVAKNLCSLGKHNILYLYRNSDMYPKTFDLYNDFLFNDDVYEFKFPKTYVFRKKHIELNKNEKYKVINMPICILYSSLLQAPFKINGYRRYNISSVYEYDAIFDLILKGIYNCRYLERYVNRLRGDKSINEFLLDRKKLIRKMLSEFKEQGECFFLHSPAFVNYIGHCTFEITDGHHRSVFLSRMNVTTIPVRINIEDYLCWENKKVVNVLKNFIENKSIVLYNPIFNPLLFNEKYNQCEDIYISNIICKYFGIYEFNSFSILDLMSGHGYYSRIFFRIGFRQIYSFECRNNYKLLFDMACKIENIKIDNLNEIETRHYDIVILMNDIRYDQIGKYVPQFSEIIKRARIFICKINSDLFIDEILLKGEFFKYTVIYSYIDSNGIINEVVIFEK